MKLLNYRLVSSPNESPVRRANLKLLSPLMSSSSWSYRITVSSSLVITASSSLFDLPAVLLSVVFKLAPSLSLAFPVFILSFDNKELIFLFRLVVLFIPGVELLGPRPATELSCLAGVLMLLNLLKEVLALAIIQGLLFFLCSWGASRRGTSFIFYTL